MQHSKRMGFIAIETVITAALILSVGLLAIFGLSASGTEHMGDAMQKLIGLGIFPGEPTSAPGEVSYDANGYPSHLNIKPGDITPEANFIFVWDDSRNGWGIEAYVDDGRSSIVVPTSRSDGLPVVSVMDGAYGWDQEHITSVVLPNTIEYIGEDSFSYMNMSEFVIPPKVSAILPYTFFWGALESIVIPSSITSIGEWAFSNNRLQSLSIPSSVSEIGESAFFHNNLTSLSIQGDSLSIGDAAFNGNQLPDSNAFFYTTLDNNTNLVSYGGANKDVVIPVGVTTLSNMAFMDTGITSVVLPEGLVVIGHQTFQRNDLVTVDLPSTLTTCGLNAFASNPRFEDPTRYFTFTWNSTLNGWNISKYASWGPKDVVIPSRRWDLKPIVSIGDNAFKLMSLTSVSMPNTIRAIGYGAFVDNNLGHVDIPLGVTTIGVHAFAQSGLTSVTIPDTVTSIGESAFQHNSLSSVSIPSSVTEIPNYAFQNNNLTSVNLPNTITRIGFQAFWQNKIASITIPNSVTSIESLAFRDNLLTSLVIPSSVTVINNGAFQNNLLTDIQFLGAMPTLGTMSAWTAIFNLNPTIPDGGIRVPMAHLTTYRNNASRLGVTTAKIVGE